MKYILITFGAILSMACSGEDSSPLAEERFIYTIDETTIEFCKANPGAHLATAERVSLSCQELNDSEAVPSVW